MRVYYLLQRVHDVEHSAFRKYRDCFLFWEFSAYKFLQNVRSFSISALFDFIPNWYRLWFSNSSVYVLLEILTRNIFLKISVYQYPAGNEQVFASSSAGIYYSLRVFVAIAHLPPLFPVMNHIGPPLSNSYFLEIFIHCIYSSFSRPSARSLSRRFPIQYSSDRVSLITAHHATKPYVSLTTYKATEWCQSQIFL